MTSGDRMGDAAPRRSAPLARIDHRALRANVESLLLRSEGDWSVADLRHDALGHGVGPVARTLLELGVDGLLVDEDRLPGLAEELPGAALRSGGEPTLDVDEVFGLPGSAGIGVMRLAGFVLVVKDLRAGEGVSYGFTHRASADTRVALVAGGYAQGIVRGLGDRVSVRLGEEQHPVIGRVAMDVCVVDIGEADAARGDEAVFFGPDDGDPPLAEWVVSTGMTAQELVAGVGQRAQREHIG
ncbi:alanine racemase C-terminal domain-containing protein [Microbacterium sp. NPDC019599]|uniref:alanine racemase n=1 Tax=Microbacterium sp. NPDC019599 TaxID=3154690 RepID=UPI00340BDDD0